MFRSSTTLRSVAPAVLSARAYATAGSKKPVKIAVTGAAGAIGYATLFRVANGEMLGKDQPVILQLLELPHAVNALNGTIMELKDCAFPLVHGIVGTDDVNKAFEDADYAMLIGSKPRTKGMERADLLRDNGKIFKVQGNALDKNAKKSVKVIVVGNPANTNALIAQRNAPSIPAENFTAMTRLDHNRGLAQLAEKTGTHVTDIQKFSIWGNHSPTMYPDLTYATIKGKPAKSVIKDDKWIVDTFFPKVQQRGAEIIKFRGASSAASAAAAAIDHMRDWALGTKGAWTSMAVVSDGSYNTPKGIVTSFPVTCENGKWSIVKGLQVDQFSAGYIQKSIKELESERDAVKDQI